MCPGEEKDWPEEIRKGEGEGEKKGREKRRRGENENNLLLLDEAKVPQTGS